MHKFFKNFNFIEFVIILLLLGACAGTVFFVFNMVGVVFGIILVIFSLDIIIKHGFNEKTRKSAMRFSIYILTAQFFLYLSFNSLPNIEFAILWILTIAVSVFLVIFSLVNKDNIINWCYTLKK